MTGEQGTDDERAAEDGPASASDMTGSMSTGSASASGTVRTPDDGSPAEVTATAGPPWFRLRDLDRRGRLVAALLALGLVLIPLVGLAVNHGRWVPQGDDALIELRARDVGSRLTPLLGQPSTSGTYGEGGENVAHPGPIEFIALAPGLRVLGPATGVLGTTALVSAACLVIVAWVLFRHAGPRAGAGGAALAALAAFSAGAGGLLDPLSSNAGRLPLLAAAVLVWALLCGDLRLTPLAVGVWSYAAQQHLSVLPASAVVAAAGAGALAWWLWRGGVEPRRTQVAFLGGGVLTGLVLWAPVLYQELTGDPGNLTALAGYSGDEQRVDLGLRSAFGQVAHVLGPRPFLGRSTPRGWDLVAERPTLLVVLTLGVVFGALAAGAWWRRAERGLVAAVAMVGVLAVGGLVTGTNIPASPEQGRLNFYHWAFSLSFFELLAIGWLLARLAPVVLPKVTHGRPATALAVAGAIVVAVAATPLVVDRSSDRLGQPVVTSALRQLQDDLHDVPGLGAEGGPLLVLVNGDDRYIQIGDSVALDLVLERGTPVAFPRNMAGFVHPKRIAATCDVSRALVISLVLPGLAEPPGTEVARVDGAPGLDQAAWARLMDAAVGQPVVLGPDLEAALAAMPGDQGELIGSTLAFRLGDPTGGLFLVRSNLELLLAHPPAEPRLARADLQALLDSLPEGAPTVVATELTAHLLTRAELADWPPADPTGC